MITDRELRTKFAVIRDLSPEPVGVGGWGGGGWFVEAHGWRSGGRRGKTIMKKAKDRPGVETKWNALALEIFENFSC